MRDNEAPVEPNKYQIPSGRCSSTIMHTAIKEFKEEIEYTKSPMNNQHVTLYLDNKPIEEFNSLVVHDIDNNTLENFLVLDFPDKNNLFF